MGDWYIERLIENEQIVMMFSSRNKWIREHPMEMQIGNPFCWDDSDVVTAATFYGAGGHALDTLKLIKKLDEL